MIKIPRHFYAREGLFCASAHYFTQREGYSAQRERFAEIIMCHSLIFFKKTYLFFVIFKKSRIFVARYAEV